MTDLERFKRVLESVERVKSKAVVVNATLQLDMLDTKDSGVFDAIRKASRFLDETEKQLKGALLKLEEVHLELKMRR